MRYFWNNVLDKKINRVLKWSILGPENLWSGGGDVEPRCPSLPTPSVSTWNESVISVVRREANSALGLEIDCYRPQRSCGKAMFYTCLWFCSQGEQTPPWADNPPGQTPPWTNTPPQQTPTLSRPPSLRDGHCSGRYASYWIAFLFIVWTEIRTVQFIRVRIVKDGQIPTQPNILNSNYRPPAKLLEGNVFTPVCHSVHGGVSPPLSPGWRHPPRRQTPWTETPAQDWHLVAATEADGTYPTGMHACLLVNLLQSSSFSILSLFLFQKHSVDMLNFEEHLSCRKLHYVNFWILKWTLIFIKLMQQNFFSFWDGPSVNWDSDSLPAHMTVLFWYYTPPKSKDKGKQCWQTRFWQIDRFSFI